MNFNQFYNNSLSEYSTKNIVLHKLSKSIEVPVILPKIKQKIKQTNDNSFSDKNLNPIRNIIITDLSNLLDRFDEDSNIKKQIIPENKNENNIKQLEYKDRFYNKFKVNLNFTQGS